MSDNRSMSVLTQLPFCMDGIRLRALREDDLCLFLGYRSDPLVARYQGWWPMDEAKARAFLREHGDNASLNATDHWVQIAVADESTDSLLGDLGVWLSRDRTEAELGVTIAPTAQCRGVGRSAMRAGLALLFADPAVTCVRASADARNTPSRRMLAAAGFREIGTAEVFVKEEACIEHRYLVQRGLYVQKIFAPIPQGEVS